VRIVNKSAIILISDASQKRVGATLLRGVAKQSSGKNYFAFSFLTTAMKQPESAAVLNSVGRLLPLVSKHTLSVSSVNS
jgi:hypothetical protein